MCHGATAVNEKGCGHRVVTDGPSYNVSRGIPHHHHHHHEKVKVSSGQYFMFAVALVKLCV